MWLLCLLTFNAGAARSASAAGLPGFGHGGWTELNIGPFSVYTQGDLGPARDQLTQLEQMRWVLGGLLDTPDLASIWPVRILFSKSGERYRTPTLIDGKGPLFAQREYIVNAEEHLALSDLAAVFLDENTPRLPADAESGLVQLLGSIDAHGSRVVWGGPVAHPDLAWARMQLFATKFEYSGSFHIFVTSLRNGSSIRVAERNAFNRDPDVLEKEVAANLAAGHWTAVSVSGRPLDPKRDLGEHAISDAVIGVYLAAAHLDEGALKAGIAAGGAAKALGYEGLAALAQREKEDPHSFFENAIAAGSTSAPLYLAAGHPKEAARLNKRWASPVHELAEQAADPREKEALLKQAVSLAPRETGYWIELAEAQIADGHVEFANGSWLRAEDSAPTAAEREQVHQLRLSKEQDRLEAEEEARKNERNAARQADAKAQDAEMQRIHAAEQRANESADAASDGAAPQEVVPWQEVAQKRSLGGTLIKVDCLQDGSDRLSIRDHAGKVTELLWPEASRTQAACGAQQRRIKVTYTPEIDDREHTSGRVVSLELQ